jgi:hypothetical protein
MITAARPRSAFCHAYRISEYYNHKGSKLQKSHMPTDAEAQPYLPIPRITVFVHA